jgi:hypothetical protein
LTFWLLVEAEAVQVVAVVEQEEMCILLHNQSPLDKHLHAQLVLKDLVATPEETLVALAHMMMVDQIQSPLVAVVEAEMALFLAEVSH